MGMNLRYSPLEYSTKDDGFDFGGAAITNAGLIGVNSVGSVFYVSNVAGAGGVDSSQNSGKSKNSPYRTIDYAIGRCKANNDDVIVVMPGHAETLATASAITVDVAGISIIGLGTGASRPTLTFSATAATMVISAASVIFKNFIVTPSIDSVVSPVVVSGADCDIDVEVQDASSTVECVSGLLTTAGADRLKLNMKYVGFLAGNAVVAPIRLVGVDTARIHVDFYGVASTAVVEFHTTACHNIDITGIFYNNGTSLTKNVVDTVTGSTWSVRGWDGNSNASFSGGDNAAMASDDVATLSAAVAVIDGFHDVPTADATTNTYMRDVVGIKTDAAVGAVTTDKSLMGYLKGVLEDTGTTIPATLATAATQDSLSPKVVVSTTATALTNDATLFTIAGGPIAIDYMVSICIATGDSGAATLQYSSDPTVGAAATISGATGSLATAVAGSMVSFVGTALATAPTFLTTGHGVASTGPSHIVVNEGIITSVVGGAASTATWQHYLRYIPLAAGVTVTAT